MALILCKLILKREPVFIYPGFVVLKYANGTFYLHMLLTVPLMAFPIQSHQITMTNYSTWNSINSMEKEKTKGKARGLLMFP